VRAQRALDTLALYGVCAVLGIAFYYQFARGELPCPLCALQRVGFIVAGAALVLNLRTGHSPAHYGLALLSAVAAGSASLRQISLHVVPNTGHYGSALFGFHFYTWAFVAYGALVVYVAVMLMIPGNAGERTRAAPLGGAALAACWVFALLAAANAVAFLAQCGLGPCPDDPTAYLWWPGR
jgi:disulfide bond formation protein DsbB